jgi:hypothetical protein
MSDLVTHRTGSFPKLFFCGPSKADTEATAVLVDEFDTRGLQGLPQCGLVCERYRNFPINHLHTTDRCNAALRSFGEIKSTPPEQRTFVRRQ